MTGKASRRGKALQKLRYDQLKAAGICVTCGKDKAIVDQIRCTYCKKKREESNRRSYLIRCRTKAKPIDYPPNGFINT
jgi:hypothetical protein